MDDREWFTEHLDEIIAKHRGRLVSVLNGEIVAVGDDLEEICEVIMEKKRRGELKGAPFTGKASADISFRYCSPMVVEGAQEASALPSAAN